MVDVSDIIKKVSEGKTVKCLKCGIGKYVAIEKDTTNIHSVYCDKCDDRMHITPNVIVD